MSLTALVLLLLVRALGTELLMDPWNPWTGLLPLFAFAIFMWSVAAADQWALPLAMLASTLIVQAHVRFLPVVAGLGIAALVLAAAGTWRALRTDRSLAATWRSWRVPLVVTIAGAVLLWLPPLAEQATHESGYLVQLARYARDPAEPVAGWVEGVRLRAHTSWVVGHGAADGLHPPMDNDGPGSGVPRAHRGAQRGAEGARPTATWSVRSIRLPYRNG